MARISDDELEEELLQVAGQAGRSKNVHSKRKRLLNDDEKGNSDSEDVSLDDVDEQASHQAEDATTSADRRTKRRQVSMLTMKKTSALGDIDENDLISDEADRARLAGMTELEREMELAERAEKRQQAIQRQQLLQAAGEGTQTNRRSGREVREEAARKSAMEELKEARLRKARGQPSRQVVDRDYEEEEEEYGEEEAEEGEEQDQEPLSDVEEGALLELDHDGGGRSRATGRWTAARQPHRDEEEEEEATYEEVKSIQVRRHKMEEWVEKPHFEMSMVGCVVRLAAGKKRDAEGSIVMDPATGLPMSHYMIAQVLGIEEREAGMHKYLSGLGGSSGWKTPYPFGPSSHLTYKWLRVMRGQSERYWPLAQVSNGPMTEEEFASWHRLCETDRRGHQITRSEVEEVQKRLIAAENYVYSAEDVKRMLEEKRAKGKVVPTNVALERARLERERDGAAEAGDQALAMEIQARLDALENAVASKGAADSKQTSMAELNKRNAQRNFATAFSAQKHSQTNRDQSGGATGELDPFSRRATRSMIYWKTRHKAGEESDTTVVDGNVNGGGTEDGRDGNGEEEQQKQRLPNKSGLESIVDLSALDLSLLDLPPAIDGFARRLLGARGASAMGNTFPAGVRTIGLGEYYSRVGQHQQQQQQQQRYSHGAPRGY
jgi:RNA polymerase-associated protein RTF1